MNIGDQTLVAVKIIIDINDYLYEWILKLRLSADLDFNSNRKVNSGSVTLPRLIDRPEKLMNPLETPSSRIRHAGVNAPALHALACS